MPRLLIIYLLLMFGLSCQSQKFSKVDKFNSYWYNGDAEITSYDLKQARYGEIHNGSAVLIFVTEDFSKSKQVKLDNPSRNPTDVSSILKLNSTRVFNTGVYTYSTMQSVFTPVNIEQESNSLKVSMSAQDWCGQAYHQLNLKEDGFELKQFSYFESEGDKVISLPKILLEDELFNKIRINPESLPIGKIKLIPSSLFLRLNHAKVQSENAESSLEKNGDTHVYTVKYSNIARRLSIYYKNEFPFEITKWEEEIKSGFGPNAKTLITTATKKKSIKIPYWEKHDRKDEVLRAELGL